MTVNDGWEEKITIFGDVHVFFSQTLKLPIASVL